MIRGRHGKFWAGMTAIIPKLLPPCLHCHGHICLEISMQDSFFGCPTSCGGPVIYKNSTFVFATTEYCVKCDNKLLEMRNII